MNNDGYTLRAPARIWEEATLCGNGTLGMLVRGGAAYEEVTLTDEALFAPVDEFPAPVPLADKMPKLRRLIDEDRGEEAVQAVFDTAKEKGVKTAFTNPFHPAADLNIVTDGIFTFDDYTRSLDFSTGEAKICFTSEKRAYTRSYFVSRADGVCVVRLRCGDGADYTVSLGEMPYVGETVPLGVIL